MCDPKLVRRWRRFLNREFKSVYPVRVKLVHPKEIPTHDGYTTASADKRFTIKISNALDWSATQITLWEEWAHVLRFHLWHVDGGEGHDQIYGAIFNQIKQAWEKYEE